MDRRIKIAPSIASADHSRLGEAVQIAEKAGADLIHFDLEDGVFLPNITFGPGTIKALRSYSSLPFDVHVELAHPEEYLAQIAEAGSDIVTVHAEACPYLHRTIQYIQSMGMDAGVAFNAVTSLDAVNLVLDEIKVIHLMTADPDREGQMFLPAVLKKVSEAARITAGREIDIEVDGGINTTNIEDVVKAGANSIVVGRGIWQAENPAEAVSELRRLALHALSS